MDARAPNRIKPTCFDSLFSLISSGPTSRVLSQKYIPKSNKINLSLTHYENPKIRLTVSTSFQSTRQPVSLRKVSKDGKDEDKQRRSNRGLNFHPRKISFNEHKKIDNQAKQKRSSVLSGLQMKNITQPLKIDKRAEIYYFYNNQIRQIQNINPHLPHNILSKRQKNPQNPQFPNQFTKNKQHTKLQTMQTGKCSTKYKPESTKDQDEDVFGSTRNSKNICFKSRQVKTKHSQQIFQQKVIQRKSLQPIKQIPPVQISTPKNTKKPSSLSQPNTQPKLIIKNPIETLFEATHTIVSKNQNSTDRERQGSFCYSDVIERYNPAMILKMNKLGKNQNESQSQNQLSKFSIQDDKIEQNNVNYVNTKKALNTRLLDRFSENVYINKKEESNSLSGKMDFKKKFTIQENSLQSSAEPQKNGDGSYKRLKYIEQIYINSNKNIKLPQNFLTNSKKSSQKTPNQSLQHHIDQKPKQIYQRFTKINYIGLGRFANVYLCSDSETNFIFAMKQILRFTIQINKMQQQLQNQIKIHQLCNHPHIITLYYHFSDTKKHYLALEYGQQTLLSKLQQNHHLTQSQSLQYLRQIALALSYLHSMNIAHRDIKPQNIILVNNICKISDFGWSSHIQSGLLYEQCGTPCYISPQIQQNIGYTTKTDCWAFGVMMWQMVNGKMGESMLKGAFNRERIQWRQGVSQNYKKIVWRLLQEQESDRVSVRELLNQGVFGVGAQDSIQ